jgi:hypothetical protein
MTIMIIIIIIENNNNNNNNNDNNRNINNNNNNYYKNNTTNNRNEGEWRQRRNHRWPHVTWLFLRRERDLVPPKHSLKEVLRQERCAEVAGG